MPRRIIDGSPNITQAYGERSNLYRKGYHTGVDYGVPVGTAIKAPTNGTVSVGDGTAASDGRGLYIRVQGDDGVEHLVYHLVRWHVSSGRVLEGQHIADSGNTGLSTGPHAHYETRRAGLDFNPADWLFATPQVATPAPAPAPTAQFVRLFGDYRTLRSSPSGAEKAKIYPNRFGHLDYRILERSGDSVKIQTQMFGEGWIYVGASVASLTQYFNA